MLPSAIWGVKKKLFSFKLREVCIIYSVNTTDVTHDLCNASLFSTKEKRCVTRGGDQKRVSENECVLIYMLLFYQISAWVFLIHMFLYAVFTVWEIQPFRLGRNVRVSCSEIRSEQAENDAQSDFLSLRADFTSALFKVVLIHKMATNWAVGHVMVRLLSNLVLWVAQRFGYDGLASQPKGIPHSWVFQDGN